MIGLSIFESKLFSDNIINAYGGEVASLSRTKEFLEAALRSEEICCLICLEGIQKTDAVSFTILNIMNCQMIFLHLFAI